MDFLTGTAGFGFQARIDARQKVSPDPLAMEGRGTDEQQSLVFGTGLQGLEPRLIGERGHFILKTVQNAVPDLGGKGQFGSCQPVRGAPGYSGGFVCYAPIREKNFRAGRRDDRS